MRQILQDMNSGKTSLIECPTPALKSASLMIATKVSLISAGTERMLVGFGKASYIDKARQQPEKVKMVLDKAITEGIGSTFAAVRSKLSQPLPLGYSNVGTVLEVADGVLEFKVGDRIVSNGPHADVVTVKKNLCARIPDEVDDDSAAFTVVGSIALQGVRLAEPTLGECFVVIGAGLIGLLAIQLLRANGCRVLAIDFDKDKLALAAQFGAETCNPSEGASVLVAAETFSRTRGVDGVIITASTKSNEPVKQAAQMARKRGRIILVGVVGLDLDRSDFYEKEISFQVSCSYGPGRYDINYEDNSVDYPIGFVRWTEQRNFEAFLDMLANEAVDVKPLISSRFDFLNAPAAYDELTSDSSSLGILLDYKSLHSDRISSSIELLEHYEFSQVRSSIGFIGAGNYASRVLIPAFAKTNSVMHTLVTSNGINSVVHGKKLGFIKASTDSNHVFNDPDINTVVIVTQHDSHAKYAKEALQSGKNVWVEKPLALDLEGLSMVKDAYREAHSLTDNSQNKPQLMVGFNRRFSPHIKKMHELLANLDVPKTLIITVNAGFIPNDHWTQNPDLGGGRIIGECCHFIDLLRFLVGKKIVSICGSAMSRGQSGQIMTDNSSITLGFDDGSVGTILYLANGPSSFPKERVEVFADGKALQLDNFRKLKGFGWNGFKKMNLISQDKGQLACVSEFIEGLQFGKSCIPVDEIFEVARVTIEVKQMLLGK